MIRFGYACINMELSAQGIRTGRAMIDRKFKLGGLRLASDIALANAQDLLTIMQWNEAHGIRLFRLGSELFPRWNHYELADMPDIDLIAQHLRAAGDYARAYGHRITTHPGPFHILGSPDAVVVDNSIVSLERHSELFDMMGFAPSFENKINIHVGATYNDKPGTIARWLHNYDRLSDSCKARLVIENDDKASMYSVRELYSMLHLLYLLRLTIGITHSIPATYPNKKHSLWLAKLGSVMVLHNVPITVSHADAKHRFLSSVCLHITTLTLPTCPIGLPFTNNTRSLPRSRSRRMLITLHSFLLHMTLLILMSWLRQKLKNNH